MVDPLAVAEKWNQLVSLRTPQVADVERLLDTKGRPIFEHIPSMLYLGDNLMLTVPPTVTAVQGGTPLLSIGLVTKSDFFAAPAQVKTDGIGGLSLLGLSLPCSAQTMLDHLNEVDPGHISVGTRESRWTIDYGRALSLVFFPLGGGTTSTATPAQSILAMVQFYYSLPYGGALSPQVKSS